MPVHERSVDVAAGSGTESSARLPVPGRRTQEERRTTARHALLTAASELVVEAGVAAVTLAAVGERAGYSRGIVTHHFGSKQGLLDALVEDAQTGLVPGLAERPPGLDRLLVLIDGYVRALERPPSQSRPFLLLWADAVGGSDLAPLMRERDEWFRAQVRADVEAGIAAGTVRADLDPTVVALRVVGELRGIGLQRVLADDDRGTTELALAVVGSWRRALSA